MSKTDIQMSVDDVQEESTSTSLAQSSASVEPSTRPTPRKLPKFPIDLNMPMMVYWPHDDNKLIVCIDHFLRRFLA